MKLLCKVACGLVFPFLITAQTTVKLGSAAAFAVLAGSTVTNTDATVLTGDLGVSPGTAITGFPPGSVTGTTHTNDGVAAQAQSDLTTAYNTAAGLTPTQILTGQDLGGLTLTAGVYQFASSAQLTGTLTLNAQGVNNAQFVFQIGSTLTTASNSAVEIINGAQSCNIFWQIGSSATLGTGTSFKGVILALTSITANTGATDIGGALLARNGAVTLDTNTINVVNACRASTTSTTHTTTSTTHTTTSTTHTTTSTTHTTTSTTATTTSTTATTTSTTATTTSTTATTTSTKATTTSTTATTTSTKATTTSTTATTTSTKATTTSTTATTTSTTATTTSTTATTTSTTATTTSTSTWGSWGSGEGWRPSKATSTYATSAWDRSYPSQTINANPSTTSTSTTLCTSPPYAPIGNVQPPSLGCNDIYTSWLSSPFKLYTNPLSSSTSYSRSNFAQACQDGCNYQHELCVSDYAGSFNGVGQSNGNVGGESGEQSYDKVVRECMQQFEDCVGLNDGINGGTHCESFGI